MHKDLLALSEDEPSPKWRDSFDALWPDLRRWYLRDRPEERPTYLAGLRALRRHMPEIVPLYEALVALAGGGDLEARFLSLYNPPAFMTGCSQAVWHRDSPLLLRNYDYRPDFWEGRLWRTGWLGRPVLGMSDCMWGLLDGVNGAGLCVSLAFGGRRVVGAGFGIPLILRYVLQVCDTVGQATETLARLPCHMAYTVTLLDPSGAFATVYLAPGEPAQITHQRVATNHQGRVDWVQHAVATGSVDRLRVLCDKVLDPDETTERFIHRFLSPPTWSDRIDLGHGTLYTACYSPERRDLTLLWPAASMRQSLDDFVERTLHLEFHPPHAQETP